MARKVSKKKWQVAIKVAIKFAKRRRWQVAIKVGNKVWKKKKVTTKFAKKKKVAGCNRVFRKKLATKIAERCLQQSLQKVVAKNKVGQSC